MRTYAYVVAFVMFIVGGALCVVGLIGTQQTPSSYNQSLTIMPPNMIIAFEAAGLLLIAIGTVLIYGVLWRRR